jgi:hypothetical protein
MDAKFDESAARISVADISSAVAVGLQRALQRREMSHLIADKILRYGGRLLFEIEIAPLGARGAIGEIQTLNEEQS